MLKSTRTPKGRIKAALRQLWLRSRERATALKNTKYCCAKCGVKQSKAKGKEQKIEVHHKEGIANWNKVIELIQAELLVSPDKLESLCPTCHRNETIKAPSTYNPYGN